jgi:hypothetical protein
MKIKHIIILVLCISIIPACSSSTAAKNKEKVPLKSEEKENLIREAKDFFNRCVALEQSFDPAMLELISDDAKVENMRIYPTGTKRKMTLTGTQYKELVRKVLPLAKLRGDTNRYFNMTFTLEGKNVRIKGTRHSNLKNYDSPISLLIAKDKKGKWLIIEHLSQSRPF